MAVCQPGEFKFAAVALDHGHIYGQCNGLVEAGGELKWVFDPDPLKVEAFKKTFPQATVAKALDQVLEDPEIQLAAAAAVPSERGALGVRVLRAGKHYFTDKTPFTELGQLADARKAVAETGKKYMVYYSERLHVECAVFAGDLIHNDPSTRKVANSVKRYKRYLSARPGEIGRRRQRQQKPDAFAISDRIGSTEI